MAAFNNGIERIRQSIANDTADCHRLIDSIRHDALRVASADAEVQAPSYSSDGELRALPPGEKPIDQVFEDWLTSLEKPHA